MCVSASVLRSSSKRNINNVGSQDVDYDIEELESSGLDGSDNEKQPKVKYEKFRGELLNKDFQFKLGMKFNSLSEFKDEIRKWYVLKGKEITFVKNESYRVRVECRGKCDFLALCSKMGDRRTYQLKTWVGTHMCKGIK